MKPKKSLGQNFLNNQKAIFEIIKAGEIVKGENILEIGPGKGALTEKILEAGGKVLAIEKDSDLIAFLTEKFEKEIKNKSFSLIEGDILEIDIEKIFKKDEKYKIIANIPYYITGAIIEKFLSINKKPEKMVLLMQKEVAERIIAKDKKESILSLATKLYGNVKMVYKVSAGSFFPKPKVDSAVISIDLYKEQINKELEKQYLNLVKKSFTHKRKIMIGNLKNEIKNVDWEEIFKKLKINTKIRAEDLSKDDFIKITNLIIDK
ncbi:MAG: 16S rRNA (adenine(1518)-N(6)/adenine(1519)-N(6))-dimethyltransferase RsmA [Candidatus Paceibacterota bacterium]